MFFFFNHNSERTEQEELVYMAKVAVCIVAALLLFSLVFCSCSTPKVVTITQYKDRIIHDTITHIDSVNSVRFVYLKGDTIHDEREVIRYKVLHEKEIVQITDSVPYPVEVVVTKEVKKPLTQWQLFMQGSGYALWGMLLLCLIILIVYIILRLKRK